MKKTSRYLVHLLPALALSLALPSAFAQGAKENFWQYKDWRSFTETGKKGTLCKAMTGGDGDHMFVVQIEPRGGNAWFYFQEQIHRGGKAIMKKDDEIVFQLDGKQPKRYDYDVSVMLGVNADGIPEAKASMPGGYAPEFIRAMRSSSSLTVLRENPGMKKQEILYKFSLDGFSANFLKLAEWCKFDANKLFQP